MRTAAARRIRVRRNPPVEAFRWIRDPRGLSILLSGDRWLRHIARNHPEVEGRYAEVVELIRAPKFITQTAAIPRIDLYYGGEPQLRIVVEIGGVEGWVVSAYERLAPAEREKVIWIPY